MEGMPPEQTLQNAILTISQIVAALGVIGTLIAFGITFVLGIYFKKTEHFKAVKKRSWQAVMRVWKKNIWLAALAAVAVAPEIAVGGHTDPQGPVALYIAINFGMILAIAAVIAIFALKVYREVVSTSGNQDRPELPADYRHERVYAPGTLASILIIQISMLFFRSISEVFWPIYLTLALRWYYTMPVLFARKTNLWRALGESRKLSKKHLMDNAFIFSGLTAGRYLIMLMVSLPLGYILALSQQGPASGVNVSTPVMQAAIYLRAYLMLLIECTVSGAIIARGLELMAERETAVSSENI